MSILVTGGAGYIGSHTCVELLNAGEKVIVLDNLINSKEEVINRVEKITGKKLLFYKIDLLDRENVKRVFDENPDIDSVIHFAGLKAVGESVRKPIEYYTNNLTGSLILFDEMRNHNVKKVVFSSSATVYGDPKKLPITEDMPLSTTNPYGTTKLFIEQILQDIYKADGEWAISILRYFNPIGAHESGLIGEDPQGIPNNLIPYIARVASGKLEKLSVYGNDYNTHDGTGVRDYIHVVDLAKGHLKAIAMLRNKQKGIYIHNLGTGHGYSVLDVVKAFEKASGKKVNYQIVARRAGDIATCYADPTKAEKELGWKAEKGIDEMCKDTWNFQQKNPDGIQ